MTPIDMILFCPSCGKQHIDRADAKPHSTHKCGRCGHWWEPLEQYTNGADAADTHALITAPVGVLVDGAYFLNTEVPGVGYTYRNCRFDDCRFEGPLQMVNCVVGKAA